MERLFWISVAGALGTGTRYLVGVWATERLGSGFPYGTLFVNLAGCFLFAFVMHAVLSFTTFPPTLHLALTAGFLGGLTTYSSFNQDLLRMLRDGAYGAAALNFAVTTTGCITAGLLGLGLALLTVGH